MDQSTDITPEERLLSSPPSKNGGGQTPQKEMNVVLNRIQELEDEYRASINQRAAKLTEQQERYSELHSAVESHTKKYKVECQRLRVALKKSEQKQAVLARRLAQTLQARNEDETSHLRQLVNMHDEQMMTMQEGMRELLKTLGVEETIIGNLDALCGINNHNNNNSNHSHSSSPAEQILYNIRRQNCELAIALRKSISIVREKLDVEENARLEAQQRASDFLDAANVVDQALQKAAAVILKEDRILSKNSSAVVDAVSVPHNNNNIQLQQQMNRQFVLFAPDPSNASDTNSERYFKNSSGEGVGHKRVSPPQFSPAVGGVRQQQQQQQQPQYLFGNNNNNNINDQQYSNSARRSDLNQSPSRGYLQQQLQQQPPQTTYYSSSPVSSTSVGASLAVLKDITFGSLDVIRDMQKIMSESKATLERQQNHAGNNNTSLSVASSPYMNFTASALAAQTQLAVDRARSAERAVAGQALLELKREIEAHQHNRTVLQRKVAFVTSQYEKLLHSVTSGEDGEYWQLSPVRGSAQNALDDEVSGEINGDREFGGDDDGDGDFDLDQGKEQKINVARPNQRSSSNNYYPSSISRDTSIVNTGAGNKKLLSGNNNNKPATVLHRTNSPSPFNPTNVKVSINNNVEEKEL